MKLGLFSAALLLHVCYADENVPEYGVDVSFPIHHTLSTNYAWLPHNVDPDNNAVPKEYEGMPVQTLGNKEALYKEFMDGCRSFYGKRGFHCDQTEADRLAMSLRQTQSMRNYTDTGFMKIRAPEGVMKLLTNHWNQNHKKQKKENWGTGNTYTNHWAAPTYMVNVEDPKLRGAGVGLKNDIWAAVRPTIEEWTGMELQPTSQYGIRVYTEGAVLSPHVDRMPLVSSCIINVAQDVEEEWPLEVYDREGKAVNVTMAPGDMVLYESHSLIHGRPFPLKGKYFANIFIHFEPTGRSHRPDIPDYTDQDLPPYIVRGTPEEAYWRKFNPGGWKNPGPTATQVELSEGHKAAAFGDVETLERLAKENGSVLHAKDRNGWQPIHEALFLSIESQGKDHPLSKYLMELGALNIGPEL